MTCKDCIHYEACLDAEIDDESITTKQEHDDMTGYCGCFKNKENFAEVIRCKDCKERYQYEDWDRDRQETVECTSCLKFHRDFGDDGFCSYGERRAE